MLRTCVFGNGTIFVCVPFKINVFTKNAASRVPKRAILGNFKGFSFEKTVENEFYSKNIENNATN